MNYPVHDLTPKEKELRQRLQEAMIRFDLKQVQVSKETGVHHSSLSLWIQGKIRGHQVGIDDTIENWLNNLQQNRPRFSKGYEARFEKYRNLQENHIVKEEIIPIEIVINQLSSQIKHQFLYNKNEKQITPDQLAKIIAEDKGLPIYIENEITQQIKQQIEDFNNTVINDNNLLHTKDIIGVIHIDILLEGIHYQDEINWPLEFENHQVFECSKRIAQDLNLPFCFQSRISYEIFKQSISIRNHINIKNNKFLNSFRLKQQRGRKTNEINYEERYY